MKHSGANGASVALTFILIGTAFLLTAIPPPTSAASVSLTGKYLLAFLACDTSVNNCSSPQNHVTHLAESNDSINWTPVPVFRPYSMGSVPDAIRRGDTVYVYNPNILVRFHLDTGVQDAPTSVGLRFANGTSATFVDPSLILDSAGTLHLFYLPGVTGGDPAQCATGQSPCTKHIMSATEVAGSNGGSFLVDSGTRADGTIQQCCFSDPAVFEGPAGYYLYVSEGQSVLAFESSTLTGSYASIPGLSGGVLVQQGTGGVPSGYYDNTTSSFWTYISQGTTVETIARASTSSISSSISGSSFSSTLSGSTFPGLGSSYTVGSPAIHLNTPGPTSTTSTSTSTSTTSTSRTTTSSASGGGIPEFPFQIVATTFFTVLLVTSFLLARHRWPSVRHTWFSWLTANKRGGRRPERRPSSLPGFSADSTGATAQLA